MIKERPIWALVVGWIGGLLIGLSVSHFIFGHWLWEVSVPGFVLNIVLTLIILTALWWRIWRPAS